MPEEMHGGGRSASPNPPSAEGQLSTREGRPSRGTGGELSRRAQEQLVRAMEQKELHRGRMAKKAGRDLADDMWANIMVSLHVRLGNLGPVEHLDPYLNSCVSNQLRKLRATVEILVGDESLALLKGDPDFGEALELNHELIELVRNIRASGVLKPAEADVFVLSQVVGQDLDTIGQWLDPPTTSRAVARIRRRAVKKVNRAYHEGKFADLGYGPTRERTRDTVRD